MTTETKPITDVRPGPAFGLVQVDLSSVIITCDDVYSGLIGVRPEDAVGRPVSDFTADLGNGGPETMIDILVRTGEPMSIRRTFLRPDGTRLPCTFQLCLIRDAEGKPHSVVAISQADPDRNT